jgi:hypothetical protein
VFCAIGVWSLRGTYLRETVDLFWHSFAGVGSLVERVSFGPLIRIRWTGGSLLSNPSRPLFLPPPTLPTPCGRRPPSSSTHLQPPPPPPHQTLATPSSSPSLQGASPLLLDLQQVGASL